MLAEAGRAELLFPFSRLLGGLTVPPPPRTPYFLNTAERKDGRGQVLLCNPLT